MERSGYQLLGPHAQRQGSDLLVQVQLLNTSPSLTRSGSVEITPGSLTALPAERFSLRQGKLLAVTVPRPAAGEAASILVKVLVRDESGHPALDQDVRVDIPALP